MTKNYKLSAMQANIMLVAGGLLFAYGAYFIAVEQSLLLLLMGGFIVALSFFHRNRNVLVFKEDRISFAPTLFGAKEMLFEEVDNVKAQRGKIIVTGTGKVKELKIGVYVFSSADRKEVSERLIGLKAQAVSTSSS